MISKVQFLIFLTIFSLSSSTAHGMDIIVDPFNAPPLGTATAILAEAYMSLVNTNTFQLNDPMNPNTITMKASTLGMMQIAPFIINSMSGGSVAINFELATFLTVKSINDCNLLPTILLTSSLQTNYPGTLQSPLDQIPASVFAIQGLTSFSISGVNFKIIPDGTNFVIGSSTTVTLNNFCIQDVNPVPPVLNCLTPVMGLQGIPTLTLTNWIFEHKSYCPIGIDANANSVITIENVIFTNSIHNYGPMFSVLPSSTASVTTTLKNFVYNQVEINEVPSPYAMLVVGSSGSGLVTTTIQNGTFNLLAATKGSVLAIAPIPPATSAMVTTLKDLVVWVNGTSTASSAITLLGTSALTATVQNVVFNVESSISGALLSIISGTAASTAALTDVTLYQRSVNTASSLIAILSQGAGQITSTIQNLALYQAGTHSGQTLFSILATSTGKIPSTFTNVTCYIQGPNAGGLISIAITAGSSITTSFTGLTLYQTAENTADSLFAVVATQGTAGLFPAISHSVTVTNAVFNIEGPNSGGVLSILGGLGYMIVTLTNITLYQKAANSADSMIILAGGGAISGTNTFTLQDWALYQEAANTGQTFVTLIMTTTPRPVTITVTNFTSNLVQGTNNGAMFTVLGQASGAITMNVQGLTLNHAAAATNTAQSLVAVVSTESTSTGAITATIQDVVVNIAGTNSGGVLSILSKPTVTATMKNVVLYQQGVNTASSLISVVGSGTGAITANFQHSTLYQQNINSGTSFVSFVGSGTGAVTATVTNVTTYLQNVNSGSMISVLSQSTGQVTANFQGLTLYQQGLNTAAAIFGIVGTSSATVVANVQNVSIYNQNINAGPILAFSGTSANLAATNFGVSLSSVAFYLNANNWAPMIAFSKVYGVGIQYLTTTCQTSDPLISPIIVAASEVGAINTTDSAIDSCTFYDSAYFSGGYGNFLVAGAGFANFTRMTASNIYLSLRNTSASKTNAYATWTTTAIPVLLFQDIVVSNLTVVAFPQNTSGFGLIARPYSLTNTPESTTIVNFTITDSNVTGAAAAFGFASGSYAVPLSGINILGLTIANSFFNYTSVIAYLPGARQSQTTITSTMQYPHTGITIYNSTFYDSYMITFVEIDTDLTVYMNESNRLVFTGLNITDSKFIVSSDVSVIDVLGCQVIVNGFSMTGSLVNGTQLFRNSLRMSSFLMTLANVTNSTFVSGSYLIGYLLDKTLYRILEAYYTSETGKMMTEFRPFMISGCLFSNLTLIDSTLFASNNPMIIINSNVFTNIILNSSILTHFQQYSPPVPLPDGSIFKSDTYAEAQVFKSYAPFQQIFDLVAAKISLQFLPLGTSTTFFLDVELNNFIGIVSNNGTMLLEVSDLSLTGTIVTILSNVFTSVSISTDKSFSIIGVTEVSSTIFQNNSMIDIMGKGNSLSVTSSTISVLLVDSNVNKNFYQTASYYIQSAICTQIAITVDVTQDIYAESSWMQIDCGLFNGSITIQNSLYQNMIVSSTPGKLLALNFMKINVQKISELTGMPNVTIQNTMFSNITLNKTQQGFIKGVFKNPVLLFTLCNTNILLDSNTFRLLKNYPDDKIMSISAPNITISSSTFSEITYYEPTGGMNLLFNTMKLLNTNFMYCYGTSSSAGGLMNLINPQIGGPAFNLTIEGCNFIRNMAPQATLMIVQNSKININVINSAFADNFIVNTDKTTGTGIISLQNMGASSLSFTNTKFQLACVSKTLGWSHATFIYISNPTNYIDISISNSRLNVNSGFTGNFFSFSRGHFVNLAMTDFTYSTGVDDLGSLLTTDPSYDSCSGTSLYGLLSTDAVVGTIENLAVTGLNISTAPLFQFTRKPYNNMTASLSIASSTFEDLKFSLEGTSDSNIIQISNETDYSPLSVYIESTTFKNIKSNSTEGGIFVQNKGNASLTALKVSSSEFNTMESVKRGGVFYGVPPFNFYNNTFKNIRSDEEGGAFFGVSGKSSFTFSTRRRLAAYGFNFDNTTSDFVMSDNNFENVSAAEGGVFFSNGSYNVWVENNNFNGIDASRRGGVFYLNDSALAPIHNNFSDISAEIAGYLIYSKNLNGQIDISGLETTYGNIISNYDGTYPIAMEPNHLDVTVTPVEANSTPFYVIETYEDSFIIRNLTSYSLAQLNFHVQVVYKDGNIVQIVADDSDYKKCSIQLTFNFVSADAKNFFSKEGDCGYANCSFVPGEITMVGEAYDIFKVDMTFTSTTFSAVKDHFYIQLRPCVIGEIRDTLSKTCFLCKENTYSLNVSDSACKECPVGAICHGGADVQLQPGFWRNISLSDSILNCEDSDDDRRCLGGFNSECDEEYEGPLCLQCNFAKGYLSIGQRRCASCPEEKSLILTGLLFLFGTIIYQLFVHYTTFKDNTKIHLESLEYTQGPPKVRPGAYIVILTTYTQISSILGKMNVGYMTELVGVSIVISNPNTKVLFSLECLYKLYNPAADLALRFKIVFFIFSPLVKLTLFALVQLLIYLIRKKTPERKRKEFLRLGVAAVVLFMLEQPGIIGVLCDYLSCTSLDPRDPASYITTNSNVQCGTDAYLWFRNGVVIPALIFWGFMVPGAILGIMWFKRRRLFKSEKLRVIFGSYYNNYSPTVFYWGIITIFFKIIMFILDSVITLKETGKSLIVLIVIHVFFALFKRQNPYTSKNLYLAELLVTMSFLMTLTVIFMKNLSEQPELRRFYDILMLLANAIPIIYLGIRLLQIYISKFNDLVDKVRGKTPSKDGKEIESSSMNQSAISVMDEKTVTNSKFGLIE